MIPHKWLRTIRPPGGAAEVSIECTVCGCEGVKDGNDVVRAHLPGPGVRISDDCDEARREMQLWRGDLP